MITNKYLLLVVDMQNDFCLPEGSLYVPGAVDDVLNLEVFILKNLNLIDHIILTQDNHHVMDISHACFWTNEQQEHPAEFTAITPEDTENGTWRGLLNPEKANEYIKKLEVQNEYPHTIWPEHCIIGSEGAAIAKPLMEAVKRWARKGKYYELIPKGTNPFTEHFGALRANIPQKNAPETDLNNELLNRLHEYENIIIAGEAKSHCVGNTIKQIIQYSDLADRLIILEDCMSNVPGFENIALSIYQDAKARGARFVNSENFLLT